MEQQIMKVIQSAVKELYDIEISEVGLKEVPKKEFGDLCFNCGILSRELKINPSIIAGKLVEKLGKSNVIDEIQVSGPYINFLISKNIYSDIFHDIYSKREEYISPQIGDNKSIVIDYIGANVGKPLHIGHMCTPNQGQVLINLYNKLGYKVISDSHIGDWGIIFGKLITAYKLWGDAKKLEENAVDYLLELYIKITAESDIKGEEIEQKTRDAFKLLSQADPKSVKLWKEFTKHSIEAMNVILHRFNITPQYNIGESFYEGLGLPKMEDYPDLKDDMHSIVLELIQAGIATQNDDNSVGVIFDDKLKIPSCILQKRDGTHGYLASDLASIKYRIQNWNPDKIVYFVDVRQNMHFKQAFTIAQTAGWIGNTELFHASNGFISGKEGAFSSRKGNIIKLDGLLDEAEERAKKIILEKREDIQGEELDELGRMIGIGAIKYGYLKKSRETDVIFDWDEFMTFEGNSGPYIQYAYVRSRRILEKFGKSFSSIDTMAQFEHTEEIDLLKGIQNYKDILLKTADTNMPHHLCGYAYDLTKRFSSFYNSVHILNEEDEDKKILRLQLIDMFSQVLKNCFEIIGIEMPEKM